MNPQKTTIAILATLSVSLALADDFKTVNGKEYKNVTVSRQEPDGIIVTNAKAGLMVKLYFTELPKEVQERFGYNAEKAVAYQRSAALAQARSGQGEASRQQADSGKQQADTGNLSGGAGRGSGDPRRGEGGSVHVQGYYRKDGTYVHSYNRAAPGAAPASRKSSR